LRIFSYRVFDEHGLRTSPRRRLIYRARNQVFPFESPHLASAQCRRSGHSNHDADCQGLYVLENRSHLIEREDVRVALTRSTLTNRGNRIELGVQCVPDAVGEECLHVIANLRLATWRKII
jgi:hypothetical protein